MENSSKIRKSTSRGFSSFYIQHIKPDKMKAKNFGGIFSGILRWD